MADRSTCANCAAFAEHDAFGHPYNPDAPDGDCRRRAPTLADTVDFFPLVRATDWCLEHVARGAAGGAD